MRPATLHHDQALKFRKEFMRADFSWAFAACLLALPVPYAGAERSCPELYTDVAASLSGPMSRQDTDAVWEEVKENYHLEYGKSADPLNNFLVHMNFLTSLTNKGPGITLRVQKYFRGDADSVRVLVDAGAFANGESGFKISIKAGEAPTLLFPSDNFSAGPEALEALDKIPRPKSAEALALEKKSAALLERFPNQLRDFPPELRPFVALSAGAGLPGDELSPGRLRIFRELADQGLIIEAGPAASPIMKFKAPSDGHSVPVLSVANVDPIEGVDAALAEARKWLEKTRFNETLARENRYQLGAKANFDGISRRLSGYLGADRDGLARASEAFQKEGGIVYFNASKDPHTRAYFKIPSNRDSAPVIVLNDWEDFTNGTYEHELLHFRDWKKIRDSLLQRGSDPAAAVSALSRYAAASPQASARSTLWMEAHATRAGETYAQSEAVRMLSEADGFVREMGIPGSATQRSVAAQTKSALDKSLGASPIVEDILRNFDPQNVYESAELLKSSLDQALDLEKLFQSRARMTNAKRSALEKFFDSKELQDHVNFLRKREGNRFRLALADKLRADGTSQEEIDSVLYELADFFSQGD